MQSYSIQSTQELISLVKSDFESNIKLIDKHLYFIDTLIRHKADKKAKYLSSEKLGETFGNRVYKPIVDYFIEKGIIETYSNRQDGRFNFNTYKLLVSTKKLVPYQLTSPLLIRTINYFHNTNYDSLRDFEKQVLYNIQKLQLPSEFNVPRLYMTKSKNTGRMFHSIVNMPKNQRKVLKHIDGIRLGEFDAKNAQLVMLSHMYNDDEVFNDAVYSGEFYKIMANEMGIDISNDESKKEFKRKFFNSILFNENVIVVANSKYGKAFKNLFPITYHHLLEMQTDTSKANELQSTESNLFIDNITRDLVNEGLFVIPIHDAIIFNLDEIERVQKIIDDNCYSVLGRLITLSLEEFCPTPCSKYTTYNNIYNKGEAEGEEEKDSHEGVYVVQNPKGVGQNKNTQLQEEKVAVITQTIKQLMADNQKITIRKVQELSGVAKATVEKHYKAIIADLSHDNIEDKQICISENKESEIACDDHILVERKSVIVEGNDIQTLPKAVKEEHKISWSQITQIEVAEEVSVVDSSVNIFELTANEIKDLGYSDIEFRTSFGQVLMVPMVYEKYWDSIKNKLGIMKRLSRENNQLGFDIELRSILQNMFGLKSAV
jgi:hypothetical protein